MEDATLQKKTGHRLIQLGVFLFFICLLTGFTLPLIVIPGMSLSSHVEGIFNGILLIVLGLIWPRLKMSESLLTATFWLAVYGTFANWSATLLAAAWGAGASMMPLAALGHRGTLQQEILINVLLFSLSFAMIFVCIFVLWGLRSIRNEF